MRNRTGLALAAVATALLSTTMASAATIKPLHSFCTDLDCTDGQDARSGLAGDGQGNWFGITTGGGANHAGTIYRLSFDGTRWKHAVLHDFCPRTGCLDGNFPEGGVVVGADGSLWGTANAGGSTDHGVIWHLTPNGRKWRIRAMHSFCIRTDCTDGARPIYAMLAYQGQDSGDLYDGVSPLYGTASEGGANAHGTLYSYTPNAKRGVFKTVYDFCKKSHCADGSDPSFGVTVDGRGHIFGADPAGGIGAGMIYEMIPNGARWTQKIAHSFCQHFDGTTCPDGASPFSAPVIDVEGNLYGTTGMGGASGGEAGGTAFKLAPNGNRYKLTKLHDFCMEKNCTDGANPGPRLFTGTDGSLYGTTIQGGTPKGNLGVVYRLGGAHKTTFATLLDLTLKTGTLQFGGYVAGPGNTMLGVFSEGGKNHGGVAYQLTP